MGVRMDGLQDISPCRTLKGVLMRHDPGTSGVIRHFQPCPLGLVGPNAPPQPFECQHLLLALKAGAKARLVAGPCGWKSAGPMPLRCAQCNLSLMYRGSRIRACEIMFWTKLSGKNYAPFLTQDPSGSVKGSFKLFSPFWSSPPPPPVDTTKTRSDPGRVERCSVERPIGAAKSNQPNTEAVCLPPPPPCDILSFVGFLTGPWTVAQSSLRRVHRVIVVCSAVGPVRVAALACMWDPVPGLLRRWRVLRGASCSVCLPGPCPPVWLRGRRPVCGVG